MYTYSMTEDAGISWHVDSHEHTERSNDWYWGLALITLAAVGISIFLGNYLFAVILLLGAGSLGTVAMRGPREHEVRLSQRGLSLDGTLYRWSAVESFWVEQHADPHLLITTQGVLHPQLVIPLLDPNRARNVREYLRRIIKEEEQEPHLGHHVVRMLGL